MSCEITHATTKYHLKKLKSNKASGPDNVSPKLLKLAGDACNDIHCYAFVAHLYVFFSNVNSCPWHLWHVNVLMQLDPMCDSFNLELLLRTVLVQLNKYNISFYL